MECSKSPGGLKFIEDYKLWRHLSTGVYCLLEAKDAPLTRLVFSFESMDFDTGNSLQSTKSDDGYVSADFSEAECSEWILPVVKKESAYMLEEINRTIGGIGAGIQQLESAVTIPSLKLS